ncbi:phage protein NinX family protein [Yersinia enterocolitica]|uniref:phage protein NinX family protein n=1 Tax=Yersinia enterocolitica TaxID=630 RepID=UPI003F469BCF
MKDYSAMTYFEINKAVANYLGKDIQPDCCQDMGNAGFGDVILQNGDSKDYCNNPADAWPIIARNEISIIFNWNEYGLHVALSELPGEYLETRDNPLRAAMIVFLMMKDRGNSHA